MDSIIEETITSPTDYDLAMVLNTMYKDKFVCASLLGKPLWYTFVQNRWEVDHGDTLRLCISREMHSLYQKKMEMTTEDIRRATENDEQERVEMFKKKMKLISDLQVRLKKTNDKK